MFQRKVAIRHQEHQMHLVVFGHASTSLPHELQALSGGANLSWVVKQALGSWVESSVLAGDSEIALSKIMAVVS